jgi:branched-chain amino acid transport system ATP-binding protein
VVRLSAIDLKLSELWVNYGPFTALKGIDMEVKRGELVVLLGANGAGKSTIFRTISGLVKPSRGEIRFLDQTISGWSPDRIVRSGIVQCAEGRKLFPGMTVFENLKMGGFIHRRNKRELRERFQYVLDLFPVLGEKRDQPAGSLSGGQQQMLAIARALMAKPKLLLLDEPSLGLAPLVVHRLFEIIQRINREGTTVLLAEQNARAALNIADRGYVMESGQIVLEGKSEALLNHDRIRKAYVGA